MYITADESPVFRLNLFRLLGPGVYFYSLLSCFQSKDFYPLLINTSVVYVLVTVTLSLLLWNNGALTVTGTEGHKGKYRCMYSGKYIHLHSVRHSETLQWVIRDKMIYNTS